MPTPRCSNLPAFGATSQHGGYKMTVEHVFSRALLNESELGCIIVIMNHWVTACLLTSRWHEARRYYLDGSRF